MVLALRGSVGAMGGASRDDIPADERFYAGGGGSIRGIGFQLAGPLDDDDKPLGGRSVVEGSVELRTRFANDFGFAVFLDAGTVDTTVFPSFEDRVLFGAGPSFRYFTPVGPLRLDIGFPLNPRGGVDDPYQSTSASVRRSDGGRPSGSDGRSAIDKAAPCYEARHCFSSSHWSPWRRPEPGLCADAEPAGTRSPP